VYSTNLKNANHGDRVLKGLRITIDPLQQLAVIISDNDFDDHFTALIILVVQSAATYQQSAETTTSSYQQTIEKAIIATRTNTSYINRAFTSAANNELLIDSGSSGGP
jgi:hypothetical protein